MQQGLPEAGAFPAGETGGRGACGARISCCGRRQAATIGAPVGQERRTDPPESDRKMTMRTSIPGIVAGLALTGMAAAAVAADGAWIPRGKPMRQFPSCYQMWVCVAKDKPEGPFSGMPRGTWGACDTSYTAGAAGSQAESCEKCLAGPPEDACKP
ncbi:MAG TPA: hypothetical protein PKC26_07280 [Plasticicumulans sp.]|uniref:hypothetical protein n=2 Tax=Plasticicumulans sp. TaxID=2307179 RepID=UPI002BEDA6A2|nr:hypothetical protein [Plasticicumulans sp.]